jgi:hypothetical protein
MATTNLMPLHPGKDGSIAKAFQRIIGYVENPEKTNDGSLVTAYQQAKALLDRIPKEILDQARHEVRQSGKQRESR